MHVARSDILYAANSVARKVEEKWPTDAYMCHALPFGTRGFDKVLDRHDVTKYGSLDYTAADGKRFYMMQDPRRKNKVRLWFLLLLLESRLH